MPKLPVLDLTDTHLTIVDLRAFLDTPAQQALMDWCTAHNIDPTTIPATATIHVDRVDQIITYERMVLVDTKKADGQTVQRRVLGADGLVTETVRYQPEKPITPWPAEVVAIAAGHTITDTDLQAALAEVAQLKAQLERAKQQVVEQDVDIAKLRATVVSLRAALRAPAEQIRAEKETK